MTTLAVLKARITTELRRSDLASQIADAIATAISAYQGNNFWFNKKRSSTFVTVAAQEFYTSSDDADIGNIEKIDYLTLVNGGTVYTLTEMTGHEGEMLAQVTATSGQPLWFSFYDGSIRLYPVPDAVYTVRVGGTIKVAAPASDAEASNPWMIEGEALIRHRAKFEIGTHVLFDDKLSAAAATGVEDALTVLRIRTAQKQQTGGWRVTPTDF